MLAEVFLLDSSHALADLAVADQPPPLPTPEDREQKLEKHHLGAARLLAEAAPLAGQSDFDVLDYDLTLFLDVAGERIEGRCAVRFETMAGSASLDELVLDLHDGDLTVTDVSYDGAPVALVDISHQADVLRIPLPLQFLPRYIHY